MGHWGPCDERVIQDVAAGEGSEPSPAGLSEVFRQFRKLSSRLKERAVEDCAVSTNPEQKARSRRAAGIRAGCEGAGDAQDYLKALGADLP